MYKNDFNLNLKPQVYLIGVDVHIEYVASKCSDLGCNFYHVDGKLISNKEDLFTYFGKELNFPGGTGTTWDGFYDCLVDLIWESDMRPKVVMYTDFSNFAKNESYDFYIAYRHMQSACDNSCNYSPPRQLYIFLQGLGKDLPDEIDKLSLQEVIF